MNESNQTNLELETEIKKESPKETETLYHYCFNINELALSRFGLNEQTLNNFKTLLTTTLAEELAREQKDNWLIVHGENTHVIMYDEKNIHNKDKEEEIMKYYLKTDKVPEDTLYLGKNGIELYSHSVEKIEKHKATLEILTEHIDSLLTELVKIEQNIELDKESNNNSKIKAILNYLEKNKLQNKENSKFKIKN